MTLVGISDVTDWRMGIVTRKGFALYGPPEKMREPWSGPAYA
jgi:hypothetical protein